MASLLRVLFLVSHVEAQYGYCPIVEGLSHCKNAENKYALTNYQCQVVCPSGKVKRSYLPYVATYVCRSDGVWRSKDNNARVPSGGLCIDERYGGGYFEGRDYGYVNGGGPYPIKGSVYPMEDGYGYGGSVSDSREQESILCSNGKEGPYWISASKNDPNPCGDGSRGYRGVTSDGNGNFYNAYTGAREFPCKKEDAVFRQCSDYGWHSGYAAHGAECFPSCPANTRPVYNTPLICESGTWKQWVGTYRKAMNTSYICENIVIQEPYYGKKFLNVIVTDPAHGCKTTSNHPCQFPFHFNGNMHYKCTRDGGQEGTTAPWCSTKTVGYPSYRYVEGFWGDCNNLCESDDYVGGGYYASERYALDADEGEGEGEDAVDARGIRVEDSN